MHGGAAPQARAAADRRIAEAGLRSELARLGIPVDGPPADALREALALARGGVRYLSARLIEAQDTAEEVGFGPLGAVIARGPRGPEVAPLVDLFGAFLDRLARIARLALDPTTAPVDGGPVRIVVESW